MRYLTLLIVLLVANCTQAQTSKELKGLSKQDSTFVCNILKNEKPQSFKVLQSINGLVLTMTFPDKVTIFILDDSDIIDIIEKGRDGKLIVYGGESD